MSAAMSKLLKQADVDHCKTVCKSHFEGNLHLNVTVDAPISANIEWTPHLYARNNREYGIDVRTEPILEPFWMDTFLRNVKPARPALRICLAFSFPVALKLSYDILRSYIENEFAVIVVYDGDIQIFGDQRTRVPSRLANSIIQTLRRRKADELIRKLRSCPRGKKHWSEYEGVCLDIFQTLFVPPLGNPVKQPATVFRVRRRDHVLPNHARQGFWFDTIKQIYKGNYVLVECKNLNQRISTEEIDQTEKYLHEKGIGQFGLILSRTQVENNAQLVQVNNWKDYQKLVIALQDAHLLEMIEMYANQQDPSEVIQREIDSFMLRVV